MKYKNIVFDFGNVIAAFDDNILYLPFCEMKNVPQFSKAIMDKWQLLDEGNISYKDYIEHTLSLLPEHLHESAHRFFKDWYQTLPPIKQTWEFIPELKKQGYRIYLLSNAPVYFADHADYFSILKEFDGILFSGPVNMWKPNADIYQHFFKKFELNPQECFFIDDKAENIAGAAACGMDGIVFTGDVEAVRALIY